MFDGQLASAFVAFIFGLAVVLLVWALLRFVPKVRPAFQEPARLPLVQVQSHSDAVLLVQSGGRVFYLNDNARAWFGLGADDLPNIEVLSRRVRPGERFFELCAAEGQARFSINGKLVDANSYHVPGALPLVLVAMRHAESVFSVEREGQESIPTMTLKTVTDFGQVVASNLSLDATLRAVLTNIEQLIPNDFLEIKVWDDGRNQLFTYRMAGPLGAERQLQRETDTQFSAYDEALIRDRKELFYPDTRLYAASARLSASSGITIGSYIGIPLDVAGQFVGTLEVGVASVNAFSNDDLSVLHLVAGQAAVAIRNAILYELQQRWNAQLYGLTSLAQAVGSLRDVKELFTHLVDGLSPLFDVNILGFLLYDEQRRVLEGQIPFFGLSNQFVGIYRTNIRPNSPAEKRILSSQLISASNAAQDDVFLDLGLQDLAQAASMRDTALIPLSSAGRFLGYLQLSNHKQSSTSLSQDELRLLNLVTNQVAAIIDNALLVQQARQRNQRAEALRRIASLVSSSADLDEILRYSVQEAAQIFQSNVCAIFIVDEQEGLMRAHKPSVFGVAADAIDSLARLQVKPSAFHLTVAGSQRAFLSGNLSKDRRVLGFYRPLVRTSNLESAMVVPLVVRGQGIGELMFGAIKPEQFNNYDLQVAATIAGQLAIAIENARYRGESQQALRRRAEQTTNLGRISRELNTTTDIKELLRIAYEEALKVSQAECGTVLFFEQTSSQDSQSIAERPIQMYLGHTPPNILPEKAVQSLQSTEPELIKQFQDHFLQPHAGVQACLYIPIAYQDEIFGLVELHSPDLDQFDDVAVEVLRTLAILTAIAAGNVLRTREQSYRADVLRRRSDTLQGLFETSQALLSDQSLEASLELIAQGIQKNSPFNVCLISLYENDSGMLRRVAGAGIPLETMQALRAHLQPWTGVAQLMKPEFEIGNLYFIPHEQSPVIPAEVQFVTLQESASEQPNAWHPDDTLLIPLYDTEDIPLGLISVDMPRNGLRPDRATLETLEAFATQAALTVISGHRIAQSAQEADSLRGEVQRQKSLVAFSQRSLPMLLHKDLEQTISISNLSQRGRHTRAGLQLTEAISRQIDSSSALMALGQQALASFDMSVSIVARETVEGPRIVHVMGNLPRGTNPEAMFGQRNPLRTCLQTGETLLSVNLEEDESWHDTPFLTALRAKSFICIPVVVNEKPISAVLTTDTEPMPSLSLEDRQVYFQISRQVSIILQNISLLSETRQRLQEVNLLLDFSRRLSGLNPSQILKTLLDSALRVVSSAHAGVVLLWDDQEEALHPLAAANYVDNESIMEITYRPEEGLPGKVFLEAHSRRVDEVNFAMDYNLSAENLLKYRKATGGRLPVSSILVPIQTIERVIGIIVLDNFNTASAFRPDDEAILLSLTQQIALSLENVRLVQTTQERAGQLQALNAVAAALGSSLNREELVAGLLDRMSMVISYNRAILWLRDSERMIVNQARGYDDNEQRIGLSVDVEDSVLLNEMIRSGLAISVGDVRADARFPSLLEAEYLSWLGLPLIAKGQVIGVIAIEKLETNYYSTEQIQLAMTFSSQAAVALENANLFEESVRRAAELDERSERLALINKFSSDLGGSLNADQVLRLTATQLLEAVQADKTMIVVLDRGGKPSLVSVLPEEANLPMVYRSMPRAPIFERMRESQSVYTTDDVAANEEVSPLREFLGGTRSLLLLPVASSQSLYVVMAGSNRAHRFSSTEIELARTLGNQAAIALENADLYQSTVATAERLATINQASFDISSNLDPETIYHSIHEAVARLMSVDAFIIAFHDAETNEVDAVYIMDMGQRISGVRLPYGQGLSGKVIASGQPLMTFDAAEADAQGGVTIGEKGTPHSIIAVPMISGGKTIGMLSAQSYQYNAYTDDDMQILSTLANQATVAIQNGRLLAEAQQLATTLEQRVVERTAELAREQRNTETLLRILTEVSASLDLDRALSRTLSLLNDAIGAEQGTIMLLHPEDNMLHYRAGYGYLTDTIQITTAPNSSFKLKIGEGLAGWVVKNRQSVMVDDLYTDPRWVVSQSSQHHRSAVVAPLVVGEDVIGAIMVFHRKVSYFTDDALEMVKAIGSQVAIAINNAQLYELIRDQAERLGQHLRTQQMEASRQTAILEAVADGVLVTDAANQITFVNASAERILNLTAARLEGQPLENFAGLFGKTTHTWVQTVQDWSEHPSSQRSGETYAEQISLDNGRVVLVHLAPVMWQNEFLGTVSIFRDITHEVEVDRLKSEFVATVSHELRTPMTSIRGYVDILLMGAAGALTEGQAHFLDIVKGNTERLNVLVNDLLDISRIESGRVTLSMQMVDLHEVAEEVVADVLRRSQEENKPMAVILDAEQKLPRVQADPERMRQVIGNLADNAYNYTSANGQITIRLHRKNGAVQVDVQDSGIGIAIEHQDRVFDRFFRGEDPLVLATPGTGLGLSIVKQLVEMHRGKIWMTSPGLPGKGSTFSFTLPVDKNEE